MRPSSFGSQHDATRIFFSRAGACRKYLSTAGTRRPQGNQQQTSIAPLLLSIDRTDRQTPDRYIDPALPGPHAMQAASIVDLSSLEGVVVGKLRPSLARCAVAAAAAAAAVSWSITSP